MVGVCQDVTEMAEIERARSEADARFRSAFENAPIGIALVDFREGLRRAPDRGEPGPLRPHRATPLRS